MEDEDNAHQRRGSEPVLQGLLADEMNVRAVHGVAHAASWCGIGRLSEAHPFRRVDIKARTL